MAICKLYIIFMAIIAPIILVIQWLGSEIHGTSIKRSSFQEVMMESSDELFYEKDAKPTTLPEYPCHGFYSHLPYCNMSLSKEERVAYIISNLTTEEKISLLGMKSLCIYKTVYADGLSNIIF